MIRVLVVEDDFRVARLHADLVESVATMTVVGVAHSAAEALAVAAETTPDLVLLDEYLPDERGSHLIGRLGAPAILVTADDTAEALRRAVRGGAVGMVLKPFPPGVLLARLEAFAHFWRLTAGDGRLDQRVIDRALAVLREGDDPAGAMPKGRSRVTAEAIREALRAGSASMTAAEVAEATGVSRATAQRYLSDLAASGRVELSLRYGTTGRPEHRYTWVAGR